MSKTATVGYRSRDGRRDPIAVVGAACRLPGADGVTEFWDLLVDGRDAVAEIPRDRFDIDYWHDPTASDSDHIVSRAGGFLPDVDKFDEAFFDLSPRAAMRLDPQQRLLLEVT